MLSDFSALVYMMFLPILFGAMAVFLALFFQQFIVWVRSLLG